MQLGKSNRKIVAAQRAENARRTYLRNPRDRSALDFALELNPQNREAQELLAKLNQS